MGGQQLRFRAAPAPEREPEPLASLAPAPPRQSRRRGPRFVAQADGWSIVKA
jgi:hypothetical protein